MSPPLILKRASASRTSGEWREDDYDVVADGIVVGRIFKANASPVGSPWMWTLAVCSGVHETGSTSIHPERGGESETEGGKEMVDVLITCGLLLIVLIAAAFLIYYFFPAAFPAAFPAFWRHAHVPNQGVIKRDWVATGRIDFATQFTTNPGDNDQPTEFKLLVEERRIVESIAGNENLEIQWRLATLREAKSVVTQYHKYLSDNSLIKTVFDETASLPPPVTTQGNPSD
jgi:hypothetical protein